MVTRKDTPKDTPKDEAPAAEVVDVDASAPSGNGDKPAAFVPKRGTVSDTKPKTRGRPNREFPEWAPEIEFLQNEAPNKWVDYADVPKCSATGRGLAKQYGVLFMTQGVATEGEKKGVGTLVLCFDPSQVEAQKAKHSK